MTQQFKFGDRVKYGATDFLFIHDKGDGRAHVVSETGVSGAVLISDLTLISHPDTVRLDWLIETCRGIDNNADTTYLDGTPFPQYSVINSGTDRASNWYGVDGGDHDDPRQAIDNAMKVEQKK